MQYSQGNWQATYKLAYNSISGHIRSILNLPVTWITSQRQYISNHNITITITDQQKKIHLNGNHDDYLKGRLAQQQKQFNRGHLHFLQVAILPDMPDNTGLCTEAAEQITIVSDGGLAAGFGTFGWEIVMLQP